MGNQTGDGTLKLIKTRIVWLDRNLMFFKAKIAESLFESSATLAQLFNISLDQLLKKLKNDLIE